MELGVSVSMLLEDWLNIKIISEFKKMFEINMGMI